MQAHVHLKNAFPGGIGNRGIRFGYNLWFASHPSPGVPIRNRADIFDNLAQNGAQASATNVTEIIVFKRFCVVSGLRNMALFVIMPSSPLSHLVLCNCFSISQAVQLAPSIFFPAQFAKCSGRVPVPPFPASETSLA